MDRTEDYMKALRHTQIRAYFFGHGENALAPHSQAAGYDDLNIFKIPDSTKLPSVGLLPAANNWHSLGQFCISPRRRRSYLRPIIVSLRAYNAFPFHCQLSPRHHMGLSKR